MSEIEQARIDVHHAGEQLAAIEYQLYLTEKQLAKWKDEYHAISNDFYAKRKRLAELRAQNDC